MGWIVVGLAVVVVLFTALVKNEAWASSRWTTLIATVLSVVAAVVGLLASKGWSFDEFTTADVFETALVVYGASQLIYNFLLKGTAVNESVNKVNVLPPYSTPTGE